jgi:hypothetical protein
VCDVVVGFINVLNFDQLSQTLGASTSHNR